MSKKGTGESAMGWIVVIGLLVAWTSWGPVWAVLILIGVLACFHVRNVYRRRYM